MEEGGFSTCLNLTAWVRAFRCNSVYIMRFRSMKVPTSIHTSYNKAKTKGLVDSGATDNFIHPQFVRRMGLGTRRLPTPKKLYNVDDTTNREGMITHYIDLDVYTNKIHKEMRFLIAGIGREDVLLGYPWLATFHPEFSWREGRTHDKYLPIELSSVHPCLHRCNARLGVCLT